MHEQNVTESIELQANGNVSLVNGRADSTHESSEQTKSLHYADPWIRRCDQPLLIQSSYAQERSQQKSIQYETPLYYRSLSSASNDQPSQVHHQPLPSGIDKDIEYVESRLRGQTTMSLPASHLAHCADEESWRRPAPRSNFIRVLPILSYDCPQAQHVSQKYSSLSNVKQPDDVAASSQKSTLQKSQVLITSNRNGSVKTVKSRIEKMKDQKAAKTLRYAIIDLARPPSVCSFFVF